MDCYLVLIDTSLCVCTTVSTLPELTTVAHVGPDSLRRYAVLYVVIMYSAYYSIARLKTEKNLDDASMRASAYYHIMRAALQRIKIVVVANTSFDQILWAKN